MAPAPGKSAIEVVVRLDERQPAWSGGVGRKVGRPDRTLAGVGQVGLLFAPVVVLAEGVRDGEAPFHQCLPESHGGNASWRQQASSGQRGSRKARRKDRHGIRVIGRGCDRGLLVRCHRAVADAVVSWRFSYECRLRPARSRPIPQQHPVILRLLI